MRQCTVPGCSNAHYAKDLCGKHYQRLCKHGSPTDGKYDRAADGEPQEFYRDVVLQYEGDECLIWPYGRSKGYGQMSVDGKPVIVSRLVCQEENGPPPTPKHQAAHSCGKGNLGCVARKHLRWATHTENMEDKLLHGTQRRGEMNHYAKLTDEQAREILSLRGEVPKAVLARRFGVSPTAVSLIHRGQRWSWLQENNGAAA